MELRILMLEDDAIDVELIQRSMRGIGLNTIFRVVSSASEYAYALEEFQPNVILADNSLPQFDARGALRYIQEKNLCIPFIMVTGKMSEEFAVNIIKSGADDYILKSSLVRLPSAIQAALRHHETERAKENAISQLVVSERNYRVLVERITDAFIALDNEWRYTYINPQAATLIHKKPEEVLGRSVWDIFPEAVGSSTYQAMVKALQEQRYQTNEDYFAPLDLWQENHIYPSPDGISMFIRDISERKRLEFALKEQKRREQQRLTATALAAQERERNAIAVELHDNVNQILVGTNLLLNILRDNPSKGKEILNSCMESIREAISENRKIAHKLVTPDLETEGLFDQLNKLVGKMLEPAGIQVNIVQEDFQENCLTSDQKLALYRIFQEQCANIVKYSGASEVLFQFRQVDSKYIILIADNGKGAESSYLHKGIGLHNISARINVLNGRTSIHTAPGQGFKLEIFLPHH